MQRSNEQIEKQNKDHKKSIDILIVIFFFAIGAAVIWRVIMSAVLAAIILILITSLISSIRQNEIVIEIRKSIAGLKNV